MNAYKLTVTLNVDSNISRSVLVPGGITFKKLHEIICIVYNLDNNEKYRFLFEDIALSIQDTGSLNRDNIDSRFELIDDYLQRYDEIKYINSYWDMKIKVTQTDMDKSYPQIIKVEGKFNPSENVTSIDEYLDAQNVEDKSLKKDLLIRVNLLEIQKLLLSLFNIPYAIENRNIIILKEEETLNNLLND